jgi:3,4-dihydroxy 2-butanone 4-phosphate synthase/GTP cyclohydrolase II
MTSLESFISHTPRISRSVTRPLITVSYAQSIDGSIAARRGYRLRLSSRASFELSHKLRTLHDAVLVGIGTVLADDPRLNVRYVRGTHPQPVILDSQLRAHKIKNNPRPGILTTAHSNSRKEKQLQKNGARIFVVPHDADGHVDIRAAVMKIRELGIKKLLVEGGARIITSFFCEQLVDRYIVTITPAIIGGVHAIERLMAQQIHTHARTLQFPTMRIAGCRQLGKDLTIYGTIIWQKT